MGSRKGRKQWAGELEEEVIKAIKQEAEEQQRPMWEIVNQSAKLFLQLDEVSSESSYKRHIENLESEIDSLERDRDELEAKIEDKRDSLQFYQEKLEEVQQNKASYAQRLDKILDALDGESNKRIISQMKELRSVASDKYGAGTAENVEKVKSDAWDRAMETERDVSRGQFEKKILQSGQKASADGSGKRESNLRINSLLSTEAADSEDDD